MLLSELTGVKAFKDKFGQEVLDLLSSKYGIRQSKGTFGVVLTHSSWQHVLKLFAKDDCYLAFVDYAIKHPNVHFPKFEKDPIKLTSFFKAGAQPSDKFYALKIEKLEPLGDAEDAIFGQAFMNQKFIDGYLLAKKDNTIKDWITNVSSKRIDPFLLKKNLGLIDALIEVGNLSITNCKIDLHSQNLMKRKDGTIVIIDPFCDAHIGNPKYDIAREISAVLEPNPKEDPNLVSKAVATDIYKSIK